MSIIGTKDSLAKDAKKNLMMNENKSNRRSSLLKKYSSKYVIREEKEDSYTETIDQ